MFWIVSGPIEGNSVEMTICNSLVWKQLCEKVASKLNDRFPVTNPLILCGTKFPYILHIQFWKVVFFRVGKFPSKLKVGHATVYIRSAIFLPWDNFALLSLVHHCDTRRGQWDKPKVFIATSSDYWALTSVYPLIINFRSTVCTVPYFRLSILTSIKLGCRPFIIYSGRYFCRSGQLPFCNQIGLGNT